MSARPSLALTPPRGVGGTAVSRPARLTSLNPKAAVQRYMQAHKVKELLQTILEEVVVSMPANPVRFVRDSMHAMLGPDEAAAEEESGGCFLRVHIECGFRGQRVWEHFSRRAPEKGFEARAMRGWRREASGVLAAAVGSVLGDGVAAWGKSPEAGKPLDDQLRALEDRVREVDEELRGARADLQKAGEVAAELRSRLAQAEADLKGGGNGEDASGAAADGSWEITEELRAKLREVFDKMDLNKDGTVDKEEISKASGLLSELHVEFGLREEVGFKDSMTFEEFEARLARELEVTRKEQALAGVKVVRAMAERLPGGSPEKPLEYLEGLGGEELRHFFRSVAAEVEELLRQQRQTLLVRMWGADGDTSGEQGNSKFAQGGDELRTAVYGKLADFSKGLVEAIGLPDPRLLEAMTREHCTSGDSKLLFSPGNYDTTTTPEAEWRAVTDPEEGRRVSVGKRVVQALAELTKDPVLQKAMLRDEEILALQLYTGPMFQKYNAVLRGFPKAVVDGLGGNKYTTTIYLIVSGVIKLSR
ncbi:hypothetical protein T484DRAFT_1826830, partial [Baffinella frigidus]